MRKLLLAAVAVMGMSGSAAAVDPGVYYCVTERMVGIRPEREAKEGEDPLDIPRFYARVVVRDSKEGRKACSGWLPISTARTQSSG